MLGALLEKCSCVVFTLIFRGFEAWKESEQAGRVYGYLLIVFDLSTAVDFLYLTEVMVI
jgi:hypothetical protein